MLIASLLSAMLVAIMSAWLGAQWVKQNVDQQFEGIKRALSTSSFPLTANVLRLLADLTHTEIISFQDRGVVRDATLPLDREAKSLLEGLLFRGGSLSPEERRFSIAIGHQIYFGYCVDRQNLSSRFDNEIRMLVLFDQEQVRATEWRAAMLPLATGLSTVLVLGTISFYLTHRLISRLKRLQSRVDIVASGNFDPRERDSVQDEVGLLSNAVDSMAEQLKILWQAVQRQQSEKLLHQISAGMAHQLRNTLTGARMALELHARHHRFGINEEVTVALREIQQAEDYIRRLMLVAMGQQDEDRPASANECLRNVQSSLAPAAKHHRVEVNWNLDTSLDSFEVKDSPTLIAAVSNLVFNAMQAGTIVNVKLEEVDSDQLRISVSDNGPGIPDAISVHIFEPFVTTKPEGMGLGLPLVRRAAEHLDGEIEWIREHNQTVFRLLVRRFEGSEN